MATRPVSVPLTQKEAGALIDAAGYSLEAPMCWERFGEGKDGDVVDKRGEAALSRALRKLRGASGY